MATTEETSLPATTDPAPKAPAQPDAAKTTPADAAAAPAAEPQPEAAAAAAEPAPPPVIPRVVIVTGASSGLGLEVSRVLGAAGHDVVMACRSEDKASRAIEKLKKENLKGSLTYMPVSSPSQLSVSFPFIVLHGNTYPGWNELSPHCSVYRVTTCLENVEMSGNLKHVREMSGIMLTVRELSGKCQRKNLVREKYPKTVHY